MPLKEFLIFINPVLIKNNVHVYIENFKNDKIQLKKIDIKNENFDFNENREKNLHFYIVTKEIKSDSNVYGEDYNKLAIEGLGGRVNNTKIERISLRVISKKPNSEVKKIFSSLKRKLNNDENIGKGVQGNSQLNKNIYYDKNISREKIFVSDMYNEKAPKFFLKNE